MAVQSGDTAQGPGSGAPAAAGMACGWRLLVCLAFATASGLLLFLSFPPVDLGPLAFAALVPLLLAVGLARGWGQCVLCGAAAGLAAYLPAFAWVASVAVSGWIGLAVYLGFYLTVAAVAAWGLQRGLGAVWPLAAALLWAGLELARARLGPGFPWLFLGYTQHRFGELIQLSALGGVYAVSFVVFFVNAGAAGVLLAALGLPRGRPSGLGRSVGMLAAAGLLLGGAALGGAAARDGVSVREGPVVGVVQHNVPRVAAEMFAVPPEVSEYLRMRDRTEDPAVLEPLRRAALAAEQRRLDRTYGEREAEVQLAAQLTARMRDERPRLVLWPETTVSVPMNLAPSVLAVERERQMLQDALDYVRDLGAEMGCHFMIGAPTYFPRAAGYVESVLYGTEVEDFGNSAVMFSPDGEFVDRYDKIRLVPFGEYVPMREHLPFLAALTPIGRELTPGRDLVLFRLPGRDGGPTVRLAALICYEDVFPDLTAAFRRRGADGFINLTDEGWYHIRGELSQHVAMAVFRAVETRTTVVRAANTGVSCFIGPRGETYARLEPLTRGTLAAPIRLCDTVTPYALYGDVFGVASLMLALILPPLLIVLRQRDDIRCGTAA